ncbi:NAD(P)-dependent oxidoreductase [Schauerella aestuarii]|uniref:NAD(P)-dependent oxidoreductase n=1 Tax=Schauerella aestuarii TaxID=2511204 RepID=UPI00136C66B3|nr:NAD(P)-dependent oxidoreductase [Achromobacter aestuarii]MYZ42279.1 NAD(P)-dependent oxidoreductase [Achromobacter aestuarii]
MTTTVAKTIGFIGLGIMGRGMAASLLRRGFEVHVHNRNRSAEGALIDAGAHGAASPAEIGARTDVVMLCLSDTEAVAAVLFGDQGLAAALKPGSFVIDASTISAQATRDHALRLGELGITLLDAPVSGGEAAAAKGELSCMVGARRDAFDHCREYLDGIASRVVHVGDPGAGQIAKACNQIAVSSVMFGVVEAFALARANGVDPAAVREALLGGAARSAVLEKNAVRLLEQDFEPGFKAELMRKDLRLAQAAAQASRADREMAVAQVILQRIEAICERGDGAKDWSVVGKLNTA